MQEDLLLTGSYFFQEDMPINTVLTKESPYSIKHKHDFFEVAYVTQGAGYHYIADKIIKVYEGDLILIPAGQPHMFQPVEMKEEGPPFRVLNGMFCPRRMAIPKDYRENWQVYGDYNNEFGTILAEIYAEQHRQSYQSRIKLVTLGSKLIELLKSKTEKVDMQVVEADEAPIHQAVHLMSMWSGYPLTLAKMSRTFAISTRHFQRLFKSVTGRSFIQMLQEIRIQQSRMMLMYTTWSIQAIAEKVGIQDMNYFYRLFRSYHGMTPAAYRKQNLIDALS